MDLLRVSGERLCGLSRVNPVLIRRPETQDGPMTMMRANMDAIRRTLESAGVELIPGNGGGPGVRLRPQAQKGED